MAVGSHGAAYIVDVQAIRKPHVIGYVTKYLTKSLSQDEKGTRKVERERTMYKRNKQGKMVKQRVSRLRMLQAVLGVSATRVSFFLSRLLIYVLVCLQVLKKQQWKNRQMGLMACH